MLLVFMSVLLAAGGEEKSGFLGLEQKKPASEEQRDKSAADETFKL